MASIYDIKPKFQNLLRPLCGKMAGMGITANQVTIGAVLLSCITGTLIASFQTQWSLLLLPLILLIRMALNAIDGMLAREFGMKSKKGAVLNEMGDVVADTALYLPLALVPGFPQWSIVICVILSIFSEMVGVIGVQIGSTRRYEGPMGKSDRAFAFGLIGLLCGLGVPKGPWIMIAINIISILLVTTIFNRARNSLLETTNLEI